MPHVVITFGFALLAIVFYYPLLSGKTLLQSDIRQYDGMSRQLKEFRINTGKETYWIDNAFGGMPTYQLGAEYPTDILSPIYSFFRILPRPAHILFLYLLGAYLLLILIKMPWPVALFGSIAFGSFLIALVQFIRIIFEYYKRQLEKAGKENKVVKILLCLTSYLLDCLERFIKFISKNAYI